MASISISETQEKYPGKTEEEIAEKIADEGDYVIVVKYKLQPDGPYTNYGLCWTYSEADDYLFNENLYDVDVIYDRRRTDRGVTEVVHNAQAITRPIKFNDDGYASESCCWNCLQFSTSLDGTHLCCRDAAGRGVVKVQQGDICDFWQQRTVLSPNGESGEDIGNKEAKSNCFIATACFGSEDCIEVMEFRHFRNQVLLCTRLGTQIVRLYYRVSPPIAVFLRQRPIIRLLTKRYLLIPMYRVIRKSRGRPLNQDKIEKV